MSQNIKTENGWVRTAGISNAAEVAVLKTMIGTLSNLTTSNKSSVVGAVNEVKASIPTSLPANGGNAATVNNLTVNTAVPSGAVFTDTKDAASLTCTSAKYGGSTNTTSVQIALNNLSAAIGNANDLLEGVLYGNS